MMRITGFGDYLIHFSPMGDERFLQADANYAGTDEIEQIMCRRGFDVKR